MSSQDKPPVSIRIRLKYPDVETFVEKYATNISRGGMFIQSRVPQPVETALRFEVLLQDDTPLLRGEGTVIWVKEYDAAHPTRVHGMGIRFTELDEASQAMLEKVLSAKSEPRGRSQTQEVRALVSAAAPADQEEPLVDASEDDDGTMVQGFAALEATPPDPIPAEPALEATPLEPTTLVAEPTPDPEQTEEPAIDPTPTDSTPPLGPAARNSEVLAALAGALEAGGDGVNVALTMAEQVLTEICESAGLDEARITAAAAEARTRVTTAGATSDELELLLTAASLPAVSFEEAQSGLAGHGVVLHSVPVAAAAPPAHTPTPPPRLAPPDPIASASLATPFAAPASAIAPPAPEPEPEDERDFDPSLLQAAARTARAAKQERNNGSFDLSDNRGGTDEFELGALPALAPADPLAPPPATPAPASADPGWRKLQTATELLDHGSAQVLQDMAARAQRHDLEEPAREERSDPIEPSFVEADDEAEHAEPPISDEALEEAVASELDREIELEPEESATAPFLEPEAIDELSREIWKEVVDEAAEELDRLELPDESIAAAAPSLEDEGGPTMLHDSLFGEERASGAVTSGEERADLDAPLGIDDDDLYEDDLSESTQVTAMPVFAGRARGRFVEAEPDAFASEPDTFATDLEPGTLEPDLDLESSSEIEDALPPDPDLSSEVFETLAGLRDTLRERPTGELAPEPALAPDPSDEVEIPSLEALADAQPAPPPPPTPAPLEDLDQLEVLATDPDDPEPKASIKPRRSGIFRRIFGKKE